jgi:hypothetical protein
VTHGVSGVLETDRLAFEENLSFFGVKEPEEHVHQGGLTRPILAEQAVNLPGLYGERDGVVSGKGAESLRYSSEFDSHR